MSDLTIPDLPLDEFSWHELLDRVSVADGHFRAFVIEHAAAKADPAIAALVEDVAARMAALYQLVAEKRFAEQP